jgi:heme exporter protein D
MVPMMALHAALAPHSVKRHRLLLSECNQRNADRKQNIVEQIKEIGVDDISQ